MIADFDTRSAGQVTVGVGLPRAALRLTGGDEPDALRVVFPRGDGVVLAVMNDQKLVAISELGGQLRAGVGPACCWQEDAHWWAISHITG